MAILSGFGVLLCLAVNSIRTNHHIWAGVIWLLTGLLPVLEPKNRLAHFTSE